jgi:hypothetical protein
MPITALVRENIHSKNSPSNIKEESGANPVQLKAKLATWRHYHSSLGDDVCKSDETRAFTFFRLLNHYNKSFDENIHFAHYLEPCVLHDKVLIHHPDTLSSMNSLAFTWKGTGRETEAVKLPEECVQSRKRVLGLNHPHTRSSCTALDTWKAKQKDVVLSVQSTGDG